MGEKQKKAFRGIVAVFVVVVVVIVVVAASVDDIREQMDQRICFNKILEFFRPCGRREVKYFAFVTFDIEIFICAFLLPNLLSQLHLTVGADICY